MPQTQGATLLVDAAGRVLAGNPAAESLLGAVRLGATGRELLGIDPDPERVVRTVVRGEDRVPRTVELRVGAAVDGGRLLLLRPVPADVLLDESRHGLDAAFELAPIGMAFLDVDGRYVRANLAHAELLGLTVDELIGIRDQELTHPDDRAVDLELVWRIFDGAMDSCTVEKRFVRPGGDVAWVIANLTFLRTAEGLPLVWLGVFQDITGRKALESRLQREALEDALTGLPNRRRMDNELRRVLARARKEGSGGALLAVDLDGFKAINDEHGHAAGDRALKGVGAALRSRLRASDIVARIGGDEFAVLLPLIEPDQARALACELVAAVTAVRVGPVGSDPLTAAIGVACFGPEGCPEAGELLARADADMYRAKSAGGGDPR